MIKVFVKIFVFVHNFSYTMISVLLVRGNDGVHPKHDIINYHQFFNKNIAKGDRVLDVGCGHGILATDLADKAGQVDAIDMSIENITIAKKKNKRPNIQYLVGDATKHNFKEKYDHIVLSNVLEHIDKRVKFLKKLKNVGETFLIRVPMINRDWLAVYKKLNGYNYKLDPTHEIEYTESQLTYELNMAGLIVVESEINFGEIWCVAKQK